jgi:hypothetical protein
VRRGEGSERLSHLTMHGRSDMMYVLAQWKCFGNLPKGWSQHSTEGEMMKPTLWLFLLLFLLGGCAITYTHPTKSAKDFEKDQRECELIAKKALVAKGIPNT